jgi:hypothetical protein
MVSSGMLHLVAFVRGCNIPEDTILHSHCRENLKSSKNCFPLTHIKQIMLGEEK